jgi:hypothetical protein
LAQAPATTQKIATMNLVGCLVSRRWPQSKKTPPTAAAPALISSINSYIGYIRPLKSDLSAKQLFWLLLLSERWKTANGFKWIQMVNGILPEVRLPLFNTVWLLSA